MARVALVTRLEGGLFVAVIVGARFAAILGVAEVLEFAGQCVDTSTLNRSVCKLERLDIVR